MAPVPRGLRIPWRSYLRTLAMVGAAAALLFGNLTGAEADTAPAPDAAATSATVTLSPKPALSGGLPTITCRITVSTPEAAFLSVYANGVVQCNHPISEIYLYVELTRNGQVMSYDEKVEDDTTGSIVLTEAPCSGGTWQAFAWANLLAPPGYVPPWGVIRKTSPAVTLNIDPNCHPVPPPPPPPPPTTTTTQWTPPPTRPCPNPPRCQEP